MKCKWQCKSGAGIVRRSLLSYAKVQSVVAKLIRNRPFQLNQQRIKSLRHLDIGCGSNVHPGLVNLDYLWHPGVDLCWDITRGLPFCDSSMRGIFTEHCLEHFDLRTAWAVLQECRRILAPGGVVRIIVPDVRMYLELYNNRLSGETFERFPFEANEAFRGVFTPILSVNRIFYQDRDSPFGHRCMYDFDLLRNLLEDVGFVSIQRSQPSGH